MPHLFQLRGSRPPPSGVETPSRNMCRWHHTTFRFRRRCEHLRYTSGVLVPTSVAISKCPADHVLHKPDANSNSTTALSRPATGATGCFRHMSAPQSGPGASSPTRLPRGQSAWPLNWRGIRLASNACRALAFLARLACGVGGKEPARRVQPRELPAQAVCGGARRAPSHSHLLAPNTNVGRTFNAHLIVVEIRDFCDRRDRTACPRARH